MKWSQFLIPIGRPVYDGQKKDFFRIVGGQRTEEGSMIYIGQRIFGRGQAKLNHHKLTPVTDRIQTQTVRAVIEMEVITVGDERHDNLHKQSLIAQIDKAIRGWKGARTLKIEDYTVTNIEEHETDV